MVMTTKANYDEQPIQPLANHTSTALDARSINVVYFGLTGAFSVLPLDALIEAGYAVRAIVLPAVLSSAGKGLVTQPYTLHAPLPPSTSVQRRALPLLASSPGRTIMQVAAKHGIPMLEVARLSDPRTLEALVAFEPDVICVACFSRRIPAEVLGLPRLGCLNVHPSLLPENRGPDPLFWTFRRGDRSTGVTIHLMDEELDAGPIVLQERVEVPDGISEAALERHCAIVGGTLLVRAIRELDAASIHPVPQDTSGASAYPWPEGEDYTIMPDRPARWAYNFAYGVLARTQPIHIITPDRTFRLIAPLGYDDNATLDAPFSLDGDVLSLQCAPGVFRARVMAI